MRHIVEITLLVDLSSNPKEISWLDPLGHLHVCIGFMSQPHSFFCDLMDDPITQQK